MVSATPLIPSEAETARMVPQNVPPDQPLRDFSSGIATALSSALIALARRDDEGNMASVRDALGAAAAEARQRDLRPEELVLAFKRIEDEVVVQLDAKSRSAHEALRSRLVSALLSAYFG